MLFPFDGYFETVKDGNPIALEMYEHHYSCYKYADGRERKLFCGPGEKMVLLSLKKDALFLWRKFIDDSGQKGINCSIFRNEGNIKSSTLIKEKEAVTLAWKRWPGERLYTYVNPKKIKSTNPGYCFQMAGWKKCGLTKGGLVILELNYIVCYSQGKKEMRSCKSCGAVFDGKDCKMKDVCNSKRKYCPLLMVDQGELFITEATGDNKNMAV